MKTGKKEFNTYFQAIPKLETERLPLDHRMPELRLSKER